MTNFDLTPLQNYLAGVSHRKRQMLLPALHHAQTLYGWLPRQVQECISTALGVPTAEIHGVIEFYSMLYNEPTGKRVIRVCEDSACTLAGKDAFIEALKGQLGLQHGESDLEREITYEQVPCLGMCDLAPAALNGDQPAGTLNPESVPDFLAGHHPEPQAKVYGGPLVLLSRIGKINPGSITDFESSGGFRGLRQAVQIKPEAVIDYLEKSGLLGRGGAMFPTGQKWRFTRSSPVPPSQKHIVVNADESEPGTFKDRVLMEGDPFALIEGAILAGYAVGAQNGWIFVRGEYPRAYKRLLHAVKSARDHGYLGTDILGVPGFNFDIEIRLGAGAYICGEETALFEAIEGKRGFPRIKPPFPTTHGLFGQPTAVNNVETMVATTVVLADGLEKWRSVGTENSSGTKLFCVSGNVRNPGIYELPFGVTIAEVVELAGGVPDHKAIQAMLIGGAAGVFITGQETDFRLTYEDARVKNIPLGSGVLMVFDEDAELGLALYELARFFAHESCGKCYPCQLGTQRQMEILKRNHANGRMSRSDSLALRDIGLAMTETSLCGLGQTAASALLSAMARFPDLAG